MRTKNVFWMLLFAGSMTALSVNAYAGNGPNSSNQGNSNHDGNGQGTGRGNGNVPVPADPNNIHGTINNGGNYNNGRNAEAPFDGGLTLLITAGIGIGIKRAYDKKKEHAQAK